MRLLAVALLLCLSIPAWAAGSAPAVPDHEVRIRVLEERQNLADRRAEAAEQGLRKYAEDQAKSEAGSVKDIAAAQVQAVREALGSNFNYLLAGVTIVIGMLVGFSVVNLFKIKDEARSLAKEEAQRVAATEARSAAMAELERMKEGLEVKVAQLETRLAERGEAALVALQSKATTMLAELGDDAAQAKAKAGEIAEFHRRMQSHMRAGARDPEERERPSVATKWDGVPLPDLADSAWMNLDQGRHDEAADQAEAILRRVKDDYTALLLLSRCRRMQGRLEDAIIVAKMALAAARSAKDEWDEGVVIGDLGNALLEVGRKAEAKEAFTRAYDISTKFLETDSGNPGRRRDLAVDQRNLARALLAMGEVEEAARWLSEAQATVDGLVRQEPENAEYRHDAARLASVWGDYHQVLGDNAGAKSHWAEAVSGLEALERNGVIMFWGRLVLKEYRDKLATA